MTRGLKDKLYEAIRGAYPNMFSLERSNLLCDELGYKRSNGERRLRELCDGEDPRVRPVRNERKYIMGYIYQPPQPWIEAYTAEQGQMFNITRQPY